MKSFKTYYARNRQQMCANRRGRYVLAEPKPDVKDMYMKEIEDCLLGDSKARAQLMAAFKKQQKIVVKRMSRVLGRTVCKIAAKRLLNKGLHMRKQHAGSLLKSTRSVNALQIRGSEDFGVGCHTASSEPYFYDSAYQHVKRDHAIPIDENGICMVANITKTDSETNKTNEPKKWESSSECKPLTTAEVDAIVVLKEAFEKPMQDLRHTLATCDDGCPNQHYSKIVDGNNSTVDLKGHPLVCSNDGGCQSKLRILRAASTHYPVLGNFMHHVHSAIRSHSCVHDIDEALCDGDFHALMEITNVDGIESLLSNDVESSYEQCHCCRFNA